MSQLYTSKSIIGRLLTSFSSLFRYATRHLLAWFLVGQYHGCIHPLGPD